MTNKLKITKEYAFSKVGVDEIEGLKQAMQEVVAPIASTLRDKMYWNSELEFTPSEYKSRDGFIPHSHNHGGLEIREVIPDCERWEFDFLEFGEWDGEHYCGDDKSETCECSIAQDGEYDASLRIWLKFEGINDAGELEFYLVMSGSNNDSPYFREKHQPVLFERSFKCKSLSGIKRAAAKSVKELIKVIK